MSSDQSTPPDYWADLFPFEPYPEQVKAINKGIQTLGTGGICTLEGPCGTGKTLIGLTIGLALIQDPSTQFSRLLAITSKKQQLKAFEEDLQAINNTAARSFPALTLIGKGELCPYVQSEAIDPDAIYHKCISLRDNTHQLMQQAVAEGNADREAAAAFGLEARAEHPRGTDDALAFDDVTAPYHEDIPDVNGTEYCPFYASHITNSVEDSFPLSISRTTTGNDLLAHGTRAGTCPHLEMRRLHQDATVILGNYQHVFDPTTVATLTGGLLDGSTLLICDEAHSLVQEVRDQLSYRTGFGTLRRAIGDINDVRDWLTGDGPRRKCALTRSIVGDADLEEPDLATAASFFEQVKSLLASKIVEGLENELGSNWDHHCRTSDVDPITIPLQPPSTLNPDVITRWASANEYDHVWDLALDVAKLVGSVKDVIAREVEGKSPDGAFPIGQVYELFERWRVGGQTEYFRCVTLHPRRSTTTSPPTDRPWRSGLYANLNVHNCIPRHEIAGTLDLFGGALLMSATLSPLSIYNDVTGVSQLARGTQPNECLITQATVEWMDDGTESADDSTSAMGSASESSDDAPADRPTTDEGAADRARTCTELTFELNFPQSNRASFAVDVPRFTWSNRMPPEEHPDVRNAYKHIITTVVRTTPGNVLVCLPSYRESAWATDILTDDPHTSKPVLTDTSSTDAETTALKRAFFKGEPKVLTTSLRGTLTEGVDFDGDKLRAVVVCGVPMRNTQSKLATATKTAYDQHFDGRGFEYAFAVPAVRKARQALGRVIRGPEEVGVRVLADERYATTDGRGTVREYFPDYAKDEFTPIPPHALRDRLNSFWTQAPID